MIKQRICGALILAICVLVLVITAHGKTNEDRDATAVLFFAPIGVYALFSKESDYNKWEE